MHMGLGIRHEWKFTYLASALAEGAGKQKAFRLSRVAVWTEAKEKLMAEVKESGLEVTESVAAAMGSTYSNSLRGGGGPTINVRADLQVKLQECHAKIQEHQQAADEYDGWVQVLTANAYGFELTQADWLYFFGKV